MGLVCLEERVVLEVMVLDLEGLVEVVIMVIIMDIMDLVEMEATMDWTMTSVLVTCSMENLVVAIVLLVVYLEGDTVLDLLVAI